MPRREPLPARPVPDLARRPLNRDTGLAAAALALLPLAKLVQFEWWPDPDGSIGRSAVRQAVLLLLVGGTTWLGTKRDDRSGRFARSVGLVPHDVPNGAAIWVVAPLALSVTATVVAIAAGARPHATLVEYIGLVIVTALGEELLFRGFLATLALRAWDSVPASIAITCSFGLWHVPDELVAGHDGAVTTAIAAAGAFTLTALGGLAFLWLRRRTGSLLGPWFAHIATNLPGLALRG